MFSKCFAGILITASVAVDAFSTSHSRIARQTVLSAVGNDSDVHCDESPLPKAIRYFVAASTVSLALLMPSSNALAQDTFHPLPVDANAFYSSSVTLSEVIRTMDFSLPGSYDSIADPVASGTEELTISTVKSSSPKKKVEKSSTPKKSTSANRGIAMPKLEFGGGGAGAGGAQIDSDAFKPKSAEEKAAILAQRRAEREEAAAAAKVEAAARDREAAAERDASIKAARLERIAKREEEQAKKAAEESAKREEMFKNAKVVDTSMPQY
ncbi:hypothetical protein ACHAW6_014940 [Cyclotella cf. meneghiniana]